ncbi:MAG: PH domain-containing protein [Methanocorpusculum sp.]|uniref:PH domain-containing protein n=1 Tax=Methanocorpusculum sp. TaxID=2058474 RepID=UPI002720C28A|nr:PH domain-containing protein [Methanocorpusculum sp.]MDO9523890.1 PH domain-containing protein [Methanocorpusculum sp.]
MVKLGEEFKPDAKYTSYLALASVMAVILIWACCVGWVYFVALGDPIFVLIGQISLGVLAGIVIFVLIWSRLYYASVVYHLNDTEMTWKRGVWFRKTGIVPYNRITNVDIVQGPVMRIFGISNLKIETAGGNSGKNSAEIQLEGIADPEPLRAMIMDFVRGNVPSPAATGVDFGRRAAPADMQALIAEVTAIRKLLEAERK